MAVITGNTFDPGKKYVSVRLQQGVPLVDADWNELQDILKYTSQVLMKWFIGNGIPAGTNGFQVAGTGLANDFVVQCGVNGSPDPLNNAGRCLVDGWEAFITADLKFTDQALHESHGAAADTESARVGAPKVTALAAPGTAGTVVAYLDVWERLVSPAEDPSLILPGLAVESCARLKREWVVRQRSGSSAPVPADGLPDFQPGHHYYALATIARRAGDALVNAADVADIRQAHLTLAGLEQRLSLLERLVLVPVFAPSPNQFNPKIGIPGTSITLFGSNLNASTPVVRFGGIAAALVGTPTATQVVAAVPAIGAGPVTITLDTVGGTATSLDSFTVLPPPPPIPAPTLVPSPNQFNPKVGQPGTTVTINGNNFNQAPQVVRFGAVAASAIGPATAAQISANVPVMPPGAVPITVQTPGGSVTSVDTFAVLPTIPVPAFNPPPNEFNPKIGTRLPATLVTLFGSNFSNPPVSVSFGGIPANISGAPTPNQITVFVPSASPPGAVHITVQTGGGAVTSTDAITVI
jgi:hypothetical protein